MYKKISSLVVSITSIIAFTGLTAYTHNYDHARQQLEGEFLIQNSNLQINVKPDIFVVDNPPASSKPASQHEHEHQHEQKVAADDVQNQPQHKEHSHSDVDAATKQKTTRTRAS